VIQVTLVNIAQARSRLLTSSGDRFPRGDLVPGRTAPIKNRIMSVDYLISID